MRIAVFALTELAHAGLVEVALEGEYPSVRPSGPDPPSSA